jgi:hypothetical protein
MLDVLHYLFEEDLLSIPDSDHAKYREGVRQNIYKNMYDKDYKFGIIKRQTTSDGESYPDDDIFIANGGAASGEVKPYIPPTNFNPDAANPFQGALREAPLG